MTCNVLDFGGPVLAPVAAALYATLTSQDYRTLVLTPETEFSIESQDYSGALDKALAGLRDGTISAVELVSKKGASFRAAICRPRFAGGSLEDWSGTAEGTGIDAAALFTRLLDINHLGYVALSFEDSPDLEMTHVTPTNFPWSDWRLRKAAVRDVDGEWIIKRNESH